MMTFNITSGDRELIDKIVDRAASTKEVLTHAVDTVSSRMDITACHANGTPLDLEKFLAFDGFNFWHDFYGIRRHLDRTTGQLDGGFLPRCAR